MTVVVVLLVLGALGAFVWLFVALSAGVAHKESAIRRDPDAAWSGIFTGADQVIYRPGLVRPDEPQLLAYASSKGYSLANIVEGRYDRSYVFTLD